MKYVVRPLLLIALGLSITFPCEAGRRAQLFRGAPQPAPLSSLTADAPVDRITRVIRPSEVDRSITRFDNSNIVMFNRSSGDHAPLVVFLPGTNGKPENAQLLLSVIANQGYRVIGLEYDDEPAVVQICPRNPNPDCSAQFRQKRIYGDDVTQVVENTPNEAIVSRLMKLLQYLDVKYPQENWHDYLNGNEPNWSKMVVSGLSQGAGMAAYIAKQKAVARVVLFSSPWDFMMPGRKLAPWISVRSATPPDRWYAEYHKRENTADLLAKSYRALGIPEANILVFDGDAPPNAGGDNPFHGSTIKLPEYIPQWQILFGKSRAQ